MATAALAGSGLPHGACMVPESPDQLSPPGASPEAVINQPQPSMPGPQQEPSPAPAPRGPSQPLDLHLSLDLHNSEEAAACAKSNGELPLSEAPPHVAAVLCVEEEAAAPVSATMSTITTAQTSTAKGLAVAAVGDEHAVLPVPACVTTASTGVAPAVAALVAMPRAAIPVAQAATLLPLERLVEVSHIVASAAKAADATADSPAEFAAALGQAFEVVGQSAGSPMNDSALLAALESAERKVMQVGCMPTWRRCFSGGVACCPKDTLCQGYIM